MSNLEIVHPNPAVPVSDLHNSKPLAGTVKPVNHSKPASKPSTELFNKHAFYEGFFSSCLTKGINPLGLLKQANVLGGLAGAGLGAGIGSAATLPLLATLGSLGSRLGLNASGPAGASGPADSGTWANWVMPGIDKAKASIDQINNHDLVGINGVGTGLGALAGGYLGHKATDPAEEENQNNFSQVILILPIELPISNVLC